MQPKLQQYATELTAAYEASGLPRSMAQVVAYLTLCEPGQQTAKNLQRELGLSAGSVSAALTLLRTSGLVLRSKAGDSRHYLYELDKDAWERSMWQRLASLEQLVIIAEKGVELMPDNPRLVTMRDIYQYFGNEFDELLHRYEAHKQQR